MATQANLSAKEALLYPIGMIFDIQTIHSKINASPQKNINE